MTPDDFGDPWLYAAEILMNVTPEPTAPTRRRPWIRRDTSGINSAVEDPFYGFNEGSAHVRVGGDNQPSQIGNARVPGAHTAFVHRSHSGRYCLVNSKVGYQNPRRFLFGDRKVEATLVGHRLPSAEDHVARLAEVQLSVRGLPIVMHERLETDDEGPDEPSDGAFALATVFPGSSLTRPPGSPAMRYALHLRILTLRERRGILLFKDHLERAADFDDVLIVDIGTSESGPGIRAAWSSTIPGAIRDLGLSGEPLRPRTPTVVCGSPEYPSPERLADSRRERARPSGRFPMELNPKVLPLSPHPPPFPSTRNSEVDTMHQSVRDQWIAFNDPLEGRVNFMYLDQKGWVSTGIGNKIDQTAAANSSPSAAERSASLALAGELRWLDGNGSPVTADLVASEWDKVKGRLDLAPRGHGSFAPPFTSLHVADDEIDRHVFAKLDQMESFLTGRPEFGAFGSWPANAQLAALSMCWALGPAFKFPKLQGHVRERNWTSAADECHFTPDEGTIKVRNKLDRAHFLLARTVEDRGLPADRLALDLSDVFGVQGALLALRFEPGRQDGADGPLTQGAVRKFQGENGLEQNGSFNDAATLAALGTRLSEAGFTVLGA
ncbi:peptidoglycan-binding domain-containing protein [Streptomyces sp. NPDC048560]|uniref:peptidoglycan-binding domain-containing protein n=1 Tax=Streptomyces sp. NPDC048560 TaxID=3155488 RepID=UPI00342F7BDE